MARRAWAAASSAGKTPAKAENLSIEACRSLREEIQSVGVG